MVMRLTPKGFAVRSCVPSISCRNRSGDIAPQAITPNPPALEIAATRRRSDTHDIAPPMMACSQPSNALPRRHNAASVWEPSRTLKPCNALKGRILGIFIT